MKFFRFSRMPIVIVLPAALLLILSTHFIKPCHAAARLRSRDGRRRLASGGSGKGKGGSGGSRSGGSAPLSREELCSAKGKSGKGKGSGGSGRLLSSGGSGKGKGGSGGSGKGSGGSGKGSGGSGKGSGGSGGSLDCERYCACVCGDIDPPQISGGSGKAGKGSGGSGKGSGGSGKAGKGSGGSNRRRLSSGGSGKGKGGSGGSGKGGKGSGGSGGSNVCGPCDCNESRQPPGEVCIKSHSGFPNTVYDPLAGWSWDITTDTVMNCDDSGIWDIGWDDDGKFDHLVLIRDGKEIERWGESCPVDYPVAEGDRLVFYTDNSHEYDGFRICLAEGESREEDGSGIEPPDKVASPSQPPEGIIQGNCFVSHATWDGLNNNYENFFGYTIPVERDTTITAASFNIRGRFTAQALRLWRDGEEVKKWQSTSGPDKESVSAGDEITFFVDDSAIYEENTGFKVCFDE